MFNLELLQVEHWRTQYWFVSFGCYCWGHADESGCYVTRPCSPEHAQSTYAARQQGCEPASKTA